jgi:hypothetical protein
MKIRKNAVKLKPEGKLLRTNGLALTPTPTLRNHWTPRSVRPRSVRYYPLLKGCLLNKFIGVTDRNRQVRAAKTIQNGEIHTNDLAIAIEERSTGTARGCCCIVDDLVL